MHSSQSPRQRGIALITTLILLVMMTLMAVSAARMGSLEERMAGNLRDRDIALRAAEMGLRDAERDLMNSVPGSARAISGCSGFTAACGGDTSDTSDDGQCNSATANYSYLTSPTVAPSVPYGRFTNATAIPGVLAQPRYLIECFTKNSDTYYRITVLARGASPGTQVMMEEVFKPTG
ncbi:PilX N-terminal domain-containing pilus assembly protein [uncultured Thiodictyon sp.]|uniref:pilus assembly PilX family protein n=1 Tax=uncultured Thiodictyon sp. TaxID=1846217 RepID=UPI0025ED5928|nr:PilX N-terminal domain-containing pilus assembly protein [uncultured Thiodictyon sp.]